MGKTYTSETHLRVNIEDLIQLWDTFKKINMYDLEDIDVLKNGKVLPNDKLAMGTFKFTGLNNMDYIKMMYL